MMSQAPTANHQMTELLANLERWQRRAELLADAAEHERALRITLEALLRSGAEAMAVEIVPALQRAARIVRADRMYTCVWDSGSKRTYAWPPETPFDERGTPANLPTDFTTAAIAEIRSGVAVTFPVRVNGANGASGSGALPVRSLLWLPIVGDHSIDGFVGCDAVDFEIYFSDERRAFLAAFGSILGFALSGAVSHRRR